MLRPIAKQTIKWYQRNWGVVGFNNSHELKGGLPSYTKIRMALAQW